MSEVQDLKITFEWENLHKGEGIIKTHTTSKQSIDVLCGDEKLTKKLIDEIKNLVKTRIEETIR